MGFCFHDSSNRFCWWENNIAHKDLTDSEIDELQVKAMLHLIGRAQIVARVDENWHHRKYTTGSLISMYTHQESENWKGN